MTDNVSVEEMGEEAQKGTRCSLKNWDKDRSSWRGSLAGTFFCPIICHYLTWPYVCLQIWTIIVTYYLCSGTSTHNITDYYYNQHHSSSANLCNCLNDIRISLDSFWWEMKGQITVIWLLSVELWPETKYCKDTIKTKLVWSLPGASFSREWPGYLLMFSDGSL